MPKLSNPDIHIIPEDLLPFIIGLWRFRVASEEPMWCMTYSYKGKYYDTLGAATILGAFNQMRLGLKKLRGKKNA